MMQTRSYDYIIEAITVVCPDCQAVFATPSLVTRPLVDASTPFEADLHCVLPYAAVRASRLAMCPQCIYTWWEEAFELAPADAKNVSQSPALAYPKKFAHAVQSGRDHGEHPLERGVMAMNGYWCARENFEAQAICDQWLDLAARELTEAIDQNFHPIIIRPRWIYVLGEVLRLLGCFDLAIARFESIEGFADVPVPLLLRQQELAQASNAEPSLLLSEEVHLIFFPERRFKRIKPLTIEEENLLREFSKGLDVQNFASQNLAEMKILAYGT